MPAYFQQRRELAEFRRFFIHVDERGMRYGFGSPPYRRKFFGVRTSHATDIDTGRRTRIHDAYYAHLYYYKKAHNA